MSRYTDEEMIRISEARRALNPHADDHRGADGHVEVICTKTHEDGGWTCRFHAPEPELFACTLCSSFEGATTTHCPGEKFLDVDDVYEGRLDYRDGQWVNGPSVHTPALWRMACERAGVEP